MKNPFIAVVVLSLAAPVFASNWEDAYMMRGMELPKLQVSGEAPSQAPALQEPRLTPEMLAAMFSAAERPADEGVVFGVMVGSVWNCRRVRELVSPGENRRLSVNEASYTFSPRDRGLRRSGADGRPSAGANLFTFVPGNGYLGSALDLKGQAYSDEIIRFTRLGGEERALITATTDDDEAGVTYGLCRAVPGS